MASILDHVQSHWQQILANSPVYTFLLRDIEIVEASAGTVTACLKVLPNHINSKNILHGTVSSCIVDWAGGMAIASTGLHNTGVSTDIHTTFISAARLGDVLEIIGHAHKIGRSLAYTSVDIFVINADDSRSPVTVGRHTKFIKRADNVVP